MSNVISIIISVNRISKKKKKQYTSLMKLWNLYESSWAAGGVEAIKSHMLKTSKEYDYSSLFTTAPDSSGSWQIIDPSYWCFYVFGYFAFGAKGLNRCVLYIEIIHWTFNYSHHIHMLNWYGPQRRKFIIHLAK